MVDRIFVVTQGGDSGYLVRPHDDIVRGAVSNCFRSRATWLWYMAENMTWPGTQIRYCEFFASFISNDTQYPSAQPPSPLKEPLSFLALLVTPWTAKEKEGLVRTQWFLNRGSGYLAEHSTQPQTLGYSLADSPVGLLAWIYEKLRNWTDSYPWEDDESELYIIVHTQSY